MQDYDDTLTREQVLNESIKELELVNKRLAKLTVRKEQLTNEIIGALGHEHEGQKSYEYEEWKLEVKTPFIYSLDKKAYQAGDYFIPEGFDPVKQSVSYTVDKKLCDHYMQIAPGDVRDVLAKLICKKPGKPSVSIKERI